MDGLFGLGKYIVRIHIVTTVWCVGSNASITIHAHGCYRNVQDSSGSEPEAGMKRSVCQTQY